MLTKYISRPREAIAYQWTPGGEEQFGVARDEQGSYVITVHGQKTYIAPGDYIVLEPDLEHCYPVKPAIFEDRYDEEKVAKAARKAFYG